MAAPLTTAQYLQARIDRIALELATTDWGPDVNDQGRSIQLNAYRESLEKSLKTLREELQKAQGPFDVYV